MTWLAVYATAVTVLLLVAVACLVILVRDGREIVKNAVEKVERRRDGAA